MLLEDATRDPGEHGTWMRCPTRGLVWGCRGPGGRPIGKVSAEERNAGAGGWQHEKAGRAACGTEAPSPRAAAAATGASPSDRFTSACPSPGSKAMQWQALRTQGESSPKTPDLQIVLENGKLRPRWAWPSTEPRVAGTWSWPHLPTGGAGDRATFLGGP